MQYFSCSFIWWGSQTGCFRASLTFGMVFSGNMKIGNFTQFSCSVFIISGSLLPYLVSKFEKFRQFCNRKQSVHLKYPNIPQGMFIPPCRQRSAAASNLKLNFRFFPPLSLTVTDPKVRYIRHDMLHQFLYRAGH